MPTSSAEVINQDLAVADAIELETVARKPSDISAESYVKAEDPLQWPKTRKWIVTSALSATSFNRIMVSTIIAPALPTLARDLKLSPVGSVMALSIYVLATAFSPLLIGPLSEIIGRAIPLHVSNLWFLAFNIMCGFAPNGPALIAGRFLAGFGAGAVYPLATAVMGDLWPPEQRGVTLALYILFPLLGAAIGPIIGGFVEQYSTWRWLFWSTSAFQAVANVVCYFCYRETHLPTIQRRGRAAVLNRQEPQSMAKHRLPKSKPSGVTRKIVSRSFALPLKQLFTHRSVQIQAALSAFSYGLTYLVLSTFSSLFVKQYHQTTAISGLHYIAPCLGEMIGSQIGGRSMDALSRKLKQKYKADRFNPVFHLPVIIPATLVTGFGLLLYGWAAQKHLHWIVVDIGALILSAASSPVGTALQAYNMDTYPDSRASTSAAVQIFRSLGAFALPLAGPAMYSKLGYGWANMLIASVGIVGNTLAVVYLWSKRGLTESKASQ